MSEESLTGHGARGTGHGSTEPPLGEPATLHLNLEIASRTGYSRPRPWPSDGSNALVRCRGVVLGVLVGERGSVVCGRRLEIDGGSWTPAPACLTSDAGVR